MDIAAHVAIQKAIIELAHSSPFFYAYGLRCSFVEDVDGSMLERNPTIGVQPQRGNAIRIVYNKKWIESLTEDELMGALIHEFMHMIMLTLSRQNNRNNEVWNIATDMANNNMIQTMRWGRDSAATLPKEGAFLEYAQKAGYTGGVVAESIYEFLYTGQESEDGDDSDGGEGEGNQQGKGKGKGLPKPMDDHDGMHPSKMGDLSLSDRNAMGDAVKASRAHAHQAGNMPGELSAYLDALMQSKIPWKQLLRQKITAIVANRGGIQKDTWRRAHRRCLPLADKRKLSIDLNIAVDTSGSVGDDQLQAFFGEIEAIIASLRCNVNLLQWDTQVNSCCVYKKGMWKQITINGRGGTDVRDLFVYLKDKKLNKNLTVVFTDGEFNQEVDLWGSHPIWVTTNAPVDLGTNIKLELAS